MTYIMGFNMSHDSSACLLRDGETRIAIALERTSREKRGIVPANEYTRRMSDLIDYCLDAENISIDDVDYFIASATEVTSPEEEQRLLQDIGIFPRHKILSMPHPSHHLSHACAAFYCSGFPTAAAVIVDAYGSLVDGGRETESIFHFSRDQEPSLITRNWRNSPRIAGQLREKKVAVPEQLFGIGEVYRVVTLALGFRQSGTYYDDAGKTMGLAGYGRPLRPEAQMIRIINGKLDYTNAINFLREYNLVFVEDGELFLSARDNSCAPSQFHKDLAAQVQWELEEALLHLSRLALEETGDNALVLSGGCFLNSVANHRIAKETSVKQMFVFPAATDDGNAIGAACYAHYVALGSGCGRKKAADTFFLGRSYANDQIEQALNKYGMSFSRAKTDFDNAERAATFLAKQKVIAWYQGGSEFGPRALGNRSILANAADPDVKSRLNERVKFRELFRPFAASTKLEDAHAYFDLAYPDSPYMLLVCQVREEYKHTISGVVHTDGTCRLQTVTSEDNPTYYHLLGALGELTGLPLALNTSFNVKGMPIVETPDDALYCFTSSDMDGLFIGAYNALAPEFAAYVPERPHLQFELRECWPPSSTQMFSNRLNPTNVCVMANGGTSTSLSGIEFSLLSEVDGVKSVHQIAKATGIDEPAAVSLSLRLYRQNLIYWKHIGPQPLARRRRAQFNLPNG